MNITAIEDDIYDWLSAIITPTPAIWLDQNAPRPDSYVGMRHTNHVTLGLNGHKSNPDQTTLAVEVVNDQEFILMLVGYGADGVSAIYTIYDALELEVTKRTLSELSSGLVYVTNESGVIDASLKIGEHMEKRVALDLRLRVGNVQSYTSDVIETINLELNLNRDQDTILSKTINIQE